MWDVFWERFYGLEADSLMKRIEENSLRISEMDLELQRAIREGQVLSRRWEIANRKREEKTDA